MVWLVGWMPAAGGDGRGVGGVAQRARECARTHRSRRALHTRVLPQKPTCVCGVHSVELIWRLRAACDLADFLCSVLLLRVRHGVHNSVAQSQIQHTQNMTTVTPTPTTTAVRCTRVRFAGVVRSFHLNALGGWAIFSRTQSAAEPGYCCFCVQSVCGRVRVCVLFFCVCWSGVGLTSGGRGRRRCGQVQRAMRTEYK